jgi:hypothetical protein
MCSLIRKPAVLLSILTLLPLASASAELQRVPLILMDRGSFDFRPNLPIADLKGDGVSTHLGNIESTGVFESLGPGPTGGKRFKGKIEGTAKPSDTATATSGETAAARSEPDSISYRLSAEFSPDASGIFYGIGTYVITGGTGKFGDARGFGVFIGLADLPPGSQSYNCFLRGVISY